MPPATTAWPDIHAEKRTARRRSWEAIVVFFISVLVILSASSLATFGLAVLLLPHVLKEFDVQSNQKGWGAAVVTALTSLAIIAFSAWIKGRQLKNGGHTVASLLGGTLLPKKSLSIEERQLRDVVEEISVAATISAPAIYVLDHEKKINALTVGLTAKDACVVVTRGALENLTRCELQCLVAHESSHVLNGDTRLNMRITIMAHALSAISFLGDGLTVGMIRACTEFAEKDSEEPAPRGCLFVPLSILAFFLVFRVIGFLLGNHSPEDFAISFVGFVVFVILIILSQTPLVDFLARCMRRMFFFCLGAVTGGIGFCLTVLILLLPIQCVIWMFGGSENFIGWGMSAFVLSLLCGVAIYPAGIMGRYLGQWLQAIICHEREFLAVACAVQFTRDPDSFVSLLKKVDAGPAGNLLRNRKTSGFAHMFFAEAFR